MSMEPNPQMRAQDTVIFLLGEVKGELKALRETVTQSETVRAEQNAAHERDHHEFRETMSEHSTALAVLQSKVVPRTPWYTIVTGIAGIGGIVLSGIALLKVLNP
jgi:hypothetical protein